MKINKFIIIVLVIILLPVSLWGQAGKVTVKGNVSDASGPLPGATVYQAGKMSNGILTGPDGGYTIMVDPDATLNSVLSRLCRNQGKGFRTHQD